MLLGVDIGHQYGAHHITSLKINMKYKNWSQTLSNSSK